MSVSARLRKLEEGVATVDRVDYAEGKPTMTVRYEDFATPEQRAATAAFVARARVLWPLLADLAEAAEELGDEIAQDEAMDGECCGRCDSYGLPEDENHVDGCPIPALRAALARVADQLDHEEGTT